MNVVQKKVLLIVNDGWGIAPVGPGNYVAQAETPFLDEMLVKYPHCQLHASGNAVGLPEGQQGNSEVGHLHMGAGRVVWQMLELINRSIKDGSLRSNPVMKELMEKAKGSRLHLMGIISDGGIHSHIDHWMAVMEMAKEYGVEDVVLHLFADGRDVPGRSAMVYVELLEKKAQELGLCKIGSTVGRYYGGDRDENWDRTQVAYDLIVSGKGTRVSTAAEAVTKGYELGAETDYYLEPFVIGEYQGMNDGEVALYMNFRTDRPRQLTRAFSEEGFSGFERGKVANIELFTLTRYDEKFKNRYVFDEPHVEDCFSSVVSSAGLRQLKISESDKRPHVTFFFNAQRDEAYPGEDRVAIDSPKVPSYDATPEMSATGVTEAGMKGIDEGYEFILVNFANCDLVGHTANREAIIKAVETVDRENRVLVEKALENGYAVILTADHGNAEEKLYDDGSPKPSHTTNPVYCFVMGAGDVQLRDGSLIDVAPTMLGLMGLAKPGGMSGESLVR